MSRRSRGFLSVLLLGLGCGPRFSPAGDVSGARTFSPASLPTSCVGALREETRKVSGTDGAGPHRDRESIRRVISAHRREIENCYAASWEAGAPGGKVSVRFVIAKGGEVCALEIRESTLHHAGMEACILNAFASWRFPASPVERTVVTYPFLFQPAPAPAGGGAPARTGG